MKIRHNYRKLAIWNDAIDIADETFNLTRGFPKEELYSLSSQLNRSSISLSSNIAEGSSRSNKSFSNYLDITLGSSYELETQLIIANRRKYIKDKEFKNIMSKVVEFQKMTSGFQNSIKL